MEREDFLNSVDEKDERLEALKQLYPEIFSDGKINIDAFKEATRTSDLAEDEEKTPGYYGLYWPGKRFAKQLAQKKATGTLAPIYGDGVNENSTHNIYIEGDNLEVLRTLRNSYRGRVKLIYIDPPYNTGNDFIYPDDFSEPVEEYLKITGQIDEKGEKLVANLKSSGAFHRNWLNMMYPRLVLARELLTDDGAIFISIDDNEHANLKLICDDIFGEENFVSSLIWAAGRKNDSKHISVSHEYMLCYFKNFSYIKEKKITWREKKLGLKDIYSQYEELKKKYGSDVESIEADLKLWYKNLPDGHPAKDHSHYSNVDEKGIYFADNISWPGGGGPTYEVLHPITKKPVKIPSRGWLAPNAETMSEWISQGRVLFGKTEDSVPTLKAYLKDREYSVPYSVFYRDGRAASKRLATLLDDKVFENPKDEEIIQRIIGFVGLNEDDIVLDFFSGSATTAHSVLLANSVNKVNRKFILVQLPIEIDPASAKTEKAKKVAENAINLLDSINKPHNICEIGKERIRRVGKNLKDDNSCLDVGFKVYRLCKSNFNKYNPVKGQDSIALGAFISQMESMIDPLVEGWKPENVLEEIKLRQGFSLDCHVEELKDITSNKVWLLSDTKLPIKLYVCLDKKIEPKTVDDLTIGKDDKFICLNSAIDDTTYARLADKKRVQTL